MDIDSFRQQIINKYAPALGGGEIKESAADCPEDHNEWAKGYNYCPKCGIKLEKESIAESTEEVSFEEELDKLREQAISLFNEDLPDIWA